MRQLEESESGCGGSPSPQPVFAQLLSFTWMKELQFTRVTVSVVEAEGPVRGSTFGETEALALKPQIVFRMVVLRLKSRQ